MPFIIINNWSSSSLVLLWIPVREGEMSPPPHPVYKRRNREEFVSHPLLRSTKGQLYSQAWSCGPTCCSARSGHGFSQLYLRPGLVREARQSAAPPPIPKLAPQWVWKELWLFSARPFLPLSFTFSCALLCERRKKCKMQKKEKRGKVIDVGSRIDMELHIGRPKHKSTPNYRSPPTCT